GVLLDSRVTRDENKAFFERLPDQHTVERILVEHRERRSSAGVSPGDRDFFETGCHRCLVERRRSFQTAGGRFDRGFPDARSAQEHVVLAVGDGRAGVRGKLLGVIEQPERDMRVEEEPQLENSSSSSGIGASKSSLIYALPFHSPPGRSTRSAVTGTSS